MAKNRERLAAAPKASAEVPALGDNELEVTKTETPSMAAGLEVTAPQTEAEATVAEHEFIDLPDAPEFVEEQEPAVDTAALDRHVTVEGTLVVMGEIYNDIVLASAALSRHLRATAGEPELHSFLHRAQTIYGEHVHSFDQVEGSLSDELRRAIQESISS